MHILDVENVTHTCACSDFNLFVRTHLRMRAVRIINFRQLKALQGGAAPARAPDTRRVRQIESRPIVVVDISPQNRSEK